MWTNSLKLIVFTVFLIFSSISFAGNKQPKEDIYDDSRYELYSQATKTNCGVYDPYMKINRKIFIVNGVLDTIILRPVAKVYGKVTNDYTKSRVQHFTDNLSEPLTTFNYALQAKGQNTLKSFWRFVINTTFGVGGLFDVASKVNLARESQSFGSTLAHYGVGAGPYIVLPIYGGVSARDALDAIFLNDSLNPLKYYLHSDFKLATTGVKIIHGRSAIMPFTDYVTASSPDPYIAIRDAILKNRESSLQYPTDFKCPVVPDL